MIITAAQIREARRLLGQSSAKLAMMSGVEFTIVLKAQLNAETGSVDPAALHALKQTLMQAGIMFADGEVQLCEPVPPTPAPPQPEPKQPHD